MLDRGTSVLMPWVDVSPDQGNDAGSQQNGATPSVPLPTDPGHLKKFVRKGEWPVTHAVRRELWHHLCLQNVVAVGSVYRETANDLYGEEGECSDVNSNPECQTFGNDEHLTTYQLSPAGRHQLARLLGVLAHTRPDISFCPLLHPIATLLLHYMDSERAFDCLSALLDSRKYKYFDQSWMEWEAFRASFTKLAKKYASRANSVITKQGVDPGLMYKDWVWWILDDLPFTHLVRVMDTYLTEGLKIFYRVALAIIVLFNKTNKGAATNAREFGVAIRQFAQKIPVTPEALLKISFQFRDLSRTIIDRYQTKFKHDVRELGILPPVKKTRSLPVVLNDINSSILTPKQLKSFWRWLPTRMSLKQPRLIFTTTENGVSLNTFYNMCQDEEQSILLVKTLNNEIFGAYLSCPWSTRNSAELKTSYFGSGESFLFTMVPKQQKFPWVGLSDRQGKRPVDTASQLFMRGTRQLISIGGGDGEGIHLESDISSGWSQGCRTFNNPPLATGGQFQCEIIEVVAFHDASNNVTSARRTDARPVAAVAQTAGEATGVPAGVPEGANEEQEGANEKRESAV